LFHFCENVDLRVVNKQVIESLIKAGAMDKLGGSRAQMMAGLEKALQIGSESQADAQMGQMSFFAGSGAESDFDKDYEKLPNVPAWPELQMLTYEKQVLGFYVTSNPLSKHAETISLYSTTDSSRLADCAEGQEVVMGGMVAKIRYRVTKNGRNAGAKMAVFVLEDLQGSAEVVIFPDAFEKNSALLVVDKIVFVRGRVDCRRQVPNIVAEELIELEAASEKIGAKVNIKLDVKEINKERIARIKTICNTHKGRSPVYVTVTTTKGKVSAMASRNFNVRPSAEFCRQMEQVVGVDNFELTK
jgi:DNA polymerase-3 subunit alpha